MVVWGGLAFYVELGWFRGHGLVDDRWAGAAVDEAVLMEVGCHCCLVHVWDSVGKVKVHGWCGDEVTVGAVRQAVHELLGDVSMVERLERRVVVQRDGVGVQVPQTHGGFVSHPKLVDAAFPAGQGTCCCESNAPLHVCVG